MGSFNISSSTARSRVWLGALLLAAYVAHVVPIRNDATDPVAGISMIEAEQAQFNKAHTRKNAAPFTPHLCVCTMNVETDLPAQIGGIESACGGASVPIVLALQDCRTCAVVGEAIMSTDFTLKAKLDPLTGKGVSEEKTCKGKVKEKDSTCGIPGIASRGVHGVASGQLYSDMTGTTEKGSVWADFDLAGTNVTVATTHGTEGIRCKNGKAGDGTTPCAAAAVSGQISADDSKCHEGESPDGDSQGKKGEKYTAYHAEKQRVTHFSQVGEILKAIERPIVWGMDMNTRRVDEQSCPVFGVQNATDVLLGRSPDFLGDQVPVQRVMTELSGFHWQHNQNLPADVAVPPPCPTYQKQPASDGGESVGACVGTYDAKKKPVTYVDRIYTNSGIKFAAVSNVPRASDHDIVCAQVMLDG